MDKDQQNRERGGEGTGRVSNAGNAAEQNAPARDISHIDRQEGDMDNGELGGNFSDKKENGEQASS